MLPQLLLLVIFALAFMQRLYSCGIIVCNQYGCPEKSGEAHIVCPADGLGAPPQISGDPSNDG